jgi:hypothetical protein
MALEVFLALLAFPQQVETVQTVPLEQSQQVQLTQRSPQLVLELAA